MTVNLQHIHHPWLMVRDMFQKLIDLIIYQAIDLLSQKLDVIQKVKEDILTGCKSVLKSIGENWVYDYKISLQ